MRVESPGERPSGRSSEVAERALDVLLAFPDSQDGELGVTQIAGMLGLEKSRVHRFLTALVNKGLVVRNPNNHRYALGPRTLALAQAALRQMDVVDVALPYLEQLRDASGETAGLAMRVGNSRVHLVQRESHNELRHRFDIGAPLPLIAGSFGKVLLAASDLPGDELLVGEQGEALRKELDEVRRCGFAESYGERVPGTHSLAAPVRRSGHAAVAIGVSGPATRFTEERGKTFIPKLLTAAAALSEVLTAH